MPQTCESQAHCFEEAINTCIDSAVVTTLILNMQMDRLFEVYDKLTPKLGKYLKTKNRLDQLKSNPDVGMADLAKFCTKETQAILEVKH